VTCLTQAHGLIQTHTKTENILKSKNTALNCEPNRRRLFFQIGTLTKLITISGPASAAEKGQEEVISSQSNLIRPFAPVEALLPALRVKFLIEESLSKALELGTGGISKDTEILDNLKSLLLKPQNITQARHIDQTPPQPAQQYLKSYYESRQNLPLLFRPGALLVQRGEIMTWQSLKQRERSFEISDEIRAALNTYTNSLEFDAARYALTASPEVRKQLIRNDALPDIKSVIASDLGLRYLYRNELLSAITEAKDEIRSLLEENLKGINVDGSELVALLKRARNACDSWLSLIDERDVESAVEFLKK